MRLTLFLSSFSPTSSPSSEDSSRRTHQLGAQRPSWPPALTLARPGLPASVRRRSRRRPLPPHVPLLVVPVPAPHASPGGPRPNAAAHGGARGRRGGRRGSDPFSPFPLWPLKRWLCSQVDMPHVECKDQEPQLLGESKERQQGEESREDEAGRGSAR